MSKIDNFWVLTDSAGRFFITSSHSSTATTADGQTFTAIGPRFSGLDELKAYVGQLIEDLRDLPAMAERIRGPG